MHTRLSHSRQLRLRSAAGTLVCDHYVKLHAERSFGHWNRKSEANFKKTQHNAKPVKKFKDEGAHACRIHVSFGFDQQLARLCVTINGSEMQSGVHFTSEQKMRSEFQKHNTTQNL